jgi:hypothetical protein
MRSGDICYRCDDKILIPFIDINAIAADGPEFRGFIQKPCRCGNEIGLKNTLWSGKQRSRSGTGCRMPSFVNPSQQRAAPCLQSSAEESNGPAT